MRKLLQFILIFLPSLCVGQSFLPMDTLTTYPKEINSIVNQEIDRVFKVDFTGDGIKDYIVQTKTEKNGNIIEIWLTSDFLIFNRISKFIGDYDFIRFVNLDNDPEPEIYSASGYSDGIDYAFYDLNMETGQLELLFYFNPVIIENEKDYWGYPWDTHGIITSKENGVTMVYHSIDHNVQQDGEVINPENQSILPVIFFKGHSTQPDIQIEEIRNRTLKTIKEIKKLCTTTE